MNIISIITVIIIPLQFRPEVWESVNRLNNVAKLNTAQTEIWS